MVTCSSFPFTGLILENGDINWNCPCLGGMATGPCGPDFREAFSCFHYSTEEPKGSECYEAFSKMQECMSNHQELYGNSKEEPEAEEEEREMMEGEGFEEKNTTTEEGNTTSEEKSSKTDSSDNKNS